MLMISSKKVRALLFLVVIAACDVLGSSMAAEMPATPVTTKPLGELLFYPYRNAPAMAISLNDTHVSSEISGTLNNLEVRVGDVVKKGELIAQVDCEDYEIAVDQAQANYQSGVVKQDFATSQLSKAKKLSKKKNISSEEVERRRSNLAVEKSEVARLRAVLKAAKRSRDKCSIYAPLTGVVTARFANLGDYLTPGSKVVRLLDQENIEVSAKVQEQDLESLQRSREMSFITRDSDYPLKLRTVLPLLESRIRSFEVRLEFGAEPATPGSAGRLQWTLPEAHIPAELLVRLDDRVGIFLEANGMAEFYPLEQAEEGRPAPLGSLQDGNVILDGRFTVEDGKAVKVSEP